MRRLTLIVSIIAVAAGASALWVYMKRPPPPPASGIAETLARSRREDQGSQGDVTLTVPAAKDAPLRRTCAPFVL